MNVMVVDDERFILAVETQEIKKALPEAEVAAFLTEEDAMHYAEENRVDIAFLDINLEETTGIEVARRLQSLNPKINVIFCTGYTEYALDALSLYCSGYLLKPITGEKLKKALEKLRYPVAEKKNRVAVQCFGNFEVYCDGVPVKFKYGRTKELLACLVDRKDALLSNRELAALLFEDDDKSSYLRNLKADLTSVLQLLGVEDILWPEQKKLGIRREKIDCDYYDYLDGQKELFQGEYMAQYSFAEETLSRLLREQSRK